MKSLAPILLASTLSFASMAFASEIGPITQERTYVKNAATSNKNLTVGRYLYVGTAPKFNGDEIELTVSKMSLTLRATGLISQEKIDTYASQLYKRWELIDETMKDPEFVLHPLVNMQNLGTDNSTKAWAKIAAQYSSHVLENRGVEVYNPTRNASSLNNAQADAYQASISTAILRYYFNDNTLTPELVRADNLLRDKLISVANSQTLFKKHHDTFVPSTQKAGYVGTVTFVYPIAATVAGPFDQPSEGVRALQNYGTIESRWWSDKWKDEFGGLPFILINPSGVAFHGPITNYSPLNVWFLRRGYVSHGCHRMDSSDILELRNMLPRTNKEIGKVKLTILNNFDVTDWNGDGKEEVVDVKYYSIPTSIWANKSKSTDEAVKKVENAKYIEAATKDWMIEKQQKSYFATHDYASKFYKPLTDTIVGAKKYKITKGVLGYDGVHGSLPIYRFDYRPNRILQYKELGVQYVPYDDNGGEFAPTYFLKN